MAFGLRNAIPSCNLGLASEGDWYSYDRATASGRRSGSKNTELHRHKGRRPIFQSGDNAALRGLGMLFGSLGELLGGCAKPIATTKSWERAPARFLDGCESNEPPDHKLKFTRCALPMPLFFHRGARAAWRGDTYTHDRRCATSARDALLRMATERLQRGMLPRAHPMPPAAGECCELPVTLPASGIGDAAALDQLANIALEGSAQLHHPGYFAHMDPASADVACAASLWQVATNQNLLHPDAAPAARTLEAQVIDWLAPFFGMRGGHLVPGSTAANLTALWAAREVAGVRRVIASDRAHNSLLKAAHLLGLAYESIPSDPRTHRCDAVRAAADGHLGDLSDAAVVHTCGTVATGAIDVLARPRGAAWVHVDGAWAAPMRLSPALAPALDGIDDADSVGFSAHKWLYQPKGCGIVLFREPAAAHAIMSYGGGYLATPTVGLLGSAPASALPLAATLLAWGRDGISSRLESDVAKAAALAKLVAADHRFELWAAPTTAVVVWRPRGVSASEVRARLQGAWVSLTVIDDETWFRSVAANPAADPELVFGRVAQAVAAVAGTVG